jgi:hypothetical protein
MEQQFPPQPQQPIAPQDNKNKIIIVVVASVIITALVVGASVYFLVKPKSDNNQQNTQISNSPTSSSTNDNNVVSAINPKNYSLVNYPLKQSSVYSQLDKDCLGSYWSDAQDTRLVKNQTEILIPSLLQVISSSENQKPNCAMSVSIFSAPSDGKYLYLQTSYNTGSDVPYSGLSGLYRLDLSNLSVNKLAVTEFLSATDLYRGSASDSYQLLADGKRLVKWNMSGAYLINLEMDSKNTLYSAPQNQWLISSIEFGMGQIAVYDVKINGNQVVIGVYDKTKTQEGYPIKIDQYENVTVESSTWDREGGTIRPKLISHQTVTIPN